MDQKSKILITFALIFIALGLIFIFQVQSLGKLRIIACDVGQGDGLLIITPQGKQIVVDGGPGTKIVDCLGSKMPFWDRTIEGVLNTHPQQDHLEGLVGVLANYNVRMIAATGVRNSSGLFGEWQRLLSSEKAKMYTPKAGDRVILESGQKEALSMDILWPTAAKLSEWKMEDPSEINQSSVVFRLNYGQFCAYFTGDIPKEILEDVIDKKCQVLKVAHHGSKTGTNERILNEVRPRLAIIQVGKNNRYGHPNKEVLDLLVSKGVKILRNDINGIIEVDSNSGGFSFKTERN